MGNQGDDSGDFEDLWGESAKPRFRFEDADALMSELLRLKLIDRVISSSRRVAKTPDPYHVDFEEFGIARVRRPSFVEDFLQAEGCKLVGSLSTSDLASESAHILYTIGVELVTPDTIHRFMEGSPMPILKARVKSHRHDSHVVAIMCGVNWAMWVRCHDNGPGTTKVVTNYEEILNNFVKLLDERLGENAGTASWKSAPVIEWLRA